MEEVKADAKVEDEVADGSELALPCKQIPSLARAFQGVDVSAIRKLRLSLNYIRSIDPIIASCASLTDLDLSINLISRIENLAPLQFLTQLSLCNNQIKEISGLDALSSLETLVKIHLC